MSDPNQSSLEPQKRPGHETTDASASTIGLFALGLALMIAIVLPLLRWMFWRLEAGAERADKVPSPLAADQEPPQPRLQSDPSADLAGLREQEVARLASYGWIDREKRVVRVPVNRAIDILAERGFPELEAPPESGEKEPVPHKEPTP